MGGLTRLGGLIQNPITSRWGKPIFQKMVPGYYLVQGGFETSFGKKIFPFVIGNHFTYHSGLFLDNRGLAIPELFWTLNLDLDRLYFETFNDMLGGTDYGPTFGMKVYWDFKGRSSLQKKCSEKPWMLCGDRLVMHKNFSLKQDTLTKAITCQIEALNSHDDYVTKEKITLHFLCDSYQPEWGREDTLALTFFPQRPQFSSPQVLALPFTTSFYGPIYSFTLGAALIFSMTAFGEFLATEK